MTQLIKKGKKTEFIPIFPKTYISSVRDKTSGKTLWELLQSFNMYFLSYTGNEAETKCLVPKYLRRKGLWVTWVNYEGVIYNEWYNNDNIDDSSWGDPANWEIVTGGKYLTREEASNLFLSKEGKALAANSADKAINDGNNRNIADTYATKGSLEELQTRLNILLETDSSEAIDTFKEIVEFLKGIEDTETLEGIIQGIINSINQKQNTINNISWEEDISVSDSTSIILNIDGTKSTPIIIPYASKATHDAKGNIIDSTYVKHIDGKSLSTNDYTNEDKQTLINLKENAVTNDQVDEKINTAVEDEVEEVLHNKIDEAIDSAIKDSLDSKVDEAIDNKLQNKVYVENNTLVLDF